MLFYVKLQLLMDRMVEMKEKSSKGEIPNPSKYSTIYCSCDKPGLGYTIFSVKDRAELDDILKKLEPYSDVYEVAQVVTLGEFEAKISGAC